MQGVTPKFGRTPGEIRHAGGALGADNRAIFVNELGLTEREFSALQTEGVI
jgi:crotonobetainyl-CoA:carnitine CoA-transferase CaiB-like acyl-CoA transferase